MSTTMGRKVKRWNGAWAFCAWGRNAMPGHTHLDCVEGVEQEDLEDLPDRAGDAFGRSGGKAHGRRRGRRCECCGIRLMLARLSRAALVPVAREVAGAPDSYYSCY